MDDRLAPVGGRPHSRGVGDVARRDVLLGGEDGLAVGTAVPEGQGRRRLGDLAGPAVKDDSKDGKELASTSPLIAAKEAEIMEV